MSRDKNFILFGNCFFIMFVAIAFIYNLNKKKVAEMTAELQARRVAEATENAVETEAVEAKAEAPETLADDVANATEAEVTEDTPQNEE